MKNKISKYKCPCCSHKLIKCGQQVSGSLYFCVCDYCSSGIWIDIKTGKDSFGRLYSTSKYTYCKCRPSELELLSSPIRCKKCNKLIHIDRIRYIQKEK